MALNRPPGPGGAMPPSPAPPGAATPMAPKMGGQETQGELMASMGLELLRKAVPLLGNSPKGQKVAEVVAKLGKEFGRPAGDLQQSQMKFMQSQLGGPQASPMDMGGQARSSLAGVGVPGAAPPMPAPAGAPGG